MDDAAINALVSGSGSGGGGAPGGQPAAGSGLDDGAIDALVSGGGQHPAAAPQAKPQQPQAAPRGGKDAFIQNYIGHEGTGSPGTSSALGFGQFTEPTWLSYVKKYRPDLASLPRDQQLALRNNRDVATGMVGHLYDEAQQSLKGNGIAPSNGASHVVAFLGPRDAVPFLKADPDAPAYQAVNSKTFPAAVQANHNVFFDRKTGQPKTVRQVRQYFAAQQQEGDQDPGNLSLGDTARLAAQNFVPDVKRNVGGIYEAVTHPMQVVEGLGKVGDAIDASLRNWGGEKVDQSRLDAAHKMASDIGDYVGRNYGSPQGFAHHVAYEPVTTGSEVALPIGGIEAGTGKVASTLAHGAELAGDASTLGRGLGAASDVARGVSQTAGAAAKAVSPVDLAASVVSPSTYRPLGLTGRITPEVDQALQRATSGALKASDIEALPATQRRAFLQTVSQKGVSEPAINEALLRAHGLDAPASLLHGEAAPEAALAAVEGARTENAYKIGDTAKTLAGAEGPHPYDMARTFAEAQANDFNRVRDSYEALAHSPGSFGTSVSGPQLTKALADKITAMDPSRPVTDLTGFVGRGDTPQAASALQRMRDVMVNGLHAFPGRSTGLDASELMQLRRDLTDRLHLAKGQDASVMKAMIEGWQDHVADLAGQGKFVDAAGKPVQGFVEGLKRANSDYASHMGTFHEGPFRGATEALGNTTDGTGRMVPSTDADAQLRAQDVLAKNLFHPTSGADAYNRLHAALSASPEGRQALDDFVRQSVLQTEGGALRPSKNVAMALRSPQSAVAKAFANDPSRLAQAKLLHAADHINTRGVRRGSHRRSVGHAVMGGLGKMAAKGAVGVIGATHGGLPGFLISQAVEHAAEKAFEAAKVGKEMKGVQRLGHKLHQAPLRAARAVASPGAMVAGHMAARAAHAAGGKVESDKERIERLVTRLMTTAKRAKKASDTKTEQLLTQPDEAIVKALAVAQKAI